MRNIPRWLSWLLKWVKTDTYTGPVVPITCSGTVSWMKLIRSVGKDIDSSGMKSLMMSYVLIFSPCLFYGILMIIFWSRLLRLWRSLVLVMIPRKSVRKTLTLPIGVSSRRLTKLQTRPSGNTPTGLRWSSC